MYPNTTINFIFCSVILIISLSVPVAATDEIQWQKIIGGSQYEQGSDISPTSDGGYIITGYSSSNDGEILKNNGMEDLWVGKFSSSGTMEGQTSLGGGADDRGVKIVQTDDGGYLIGGQTKSNDGDVAGFLGEEDIWILKLDSSGAIEWQKSLGGSKSEGIANIHVSSNGNYLITGHTVSSDGDVSKNSGGYDVWIVELAPDGKIQWEKTFGGSRDDWGGDVIDTADGGYLFLGTTQSNNGNVVSNHGGYDLWVVKLRSDRSIEWQTSLGGKQDENGKRIIPLQTGGYAILGSTSSSEGDVVGNHGGYDIWLVKLTSDGIIEWTKCIGGSATDIAFESRETSDNGYLLAGFTESNDGDVLSSSGSRDAWIIKLTPEGNIDWQKRFGGSDLDWVSSIQGSGQSLIFTGATQSKDGTYSGNHGNADIWIGKIDLGSSNIGSLPISNNNRVLNNVKSEDVGAFSFLPKAFLSLFSWVIPSGSTSSFETGQTTAQKETSKSTAQTTHFGTSNSDVQTTVTVKKTAPSQSANCAKKKLTVEVWSDFLWKLDYNDGDIVKHGSGSKTYTFDKQCEWTFIWLTDDSVAHPEIIEKMIYTDPNFKLVVKEDGKVIGTISKPSQDGVSFFILPSGKMVTTNSLSEYTQYWMELRRYEENKG